MLRLNTSCVLVVTSHTYTVITFSTFSLIIFIPQSLHQCHAGHVSALIYFNLMKTDQISQLTSIQEHVSHQTTGVLSIYIQLSLASMSFFRI